MRCAVGLVFALVGCESADRSPLAVRDAGLPVVDPPNACRFTEQFGPSFWVASTCDVRERAHLSLAGPATVLSTTPLAIGFDEGDAYVRPRGPFALPIAAGARVWARAGAGGPLEGFGVLVLREGGEGGRLLAAIWSGDERMLPLFGIPATFEDEDCAARTFPCGGVLSRTMHIEIGGERVIVPNESEARAGDYRVINAHAHRYLEQPRCSESDLTFTVGAVLADDLPMPSPPVRTATLAAPRGGLRQISVGPDQACGVRDDGSITCWGTTAALPGTFEEVAVGWDHVCGRAATGAVLCTGSGPSTVPGTFKQISAGRGYTCGVQVDGLVSCWGGSAPHSPPGRFTQVSAGASFPCGVLESGEVGCWSVPWWLPSPPLGAFASVAVGFDRACALRGDGRLSCWGGSDAFCNASPEGRFQAVGISRDIACGLRADGTLACAGPGAAIPPAGVFRALGVGDEMACALDVAGAATCWRPRG